MGRSDLTAMLMGGAAVIAVAVPAQAQTATYNIPKGELRAALATYIRQSGVQLVFRTEDVRGKRTRGVRGAMSAEAALDQLLAGTGLSAVRDANGAVVVASRQAQRAEGNEDGAESADAGATPEILVTGKREWTLNTDIKRTRDDAQPYVVFDREQIQRSGSTNLEDFFRDYLPQNAGATPSSANGYQNQAAGSISLRGLGTGETLILVDGRRIAPRRDGSASINQPNITGIPMAAIERIEVLASSASGIYGGSATGGVINIILKRDYRGLDVTASYGGTYDGGNTRRRVDIATGSNIFGGNTNVMVTGSWQKTDPLFTDQRDWMNDYRKRLYALVPTTNNGLPLGATPNIRSSTGATLTLKPAYGGGSLGSPFTYVPYGYRGVGLDGVAPLVANAGQYNWDFAPTAQSGGNGNRGGRYSLVSGNEDLSGNIAIRQTVTSWLKAFVEINGSISRGEIEQTSIPSLVTLAASAPNNPFNQSINVMVPHIGFPGTIRFKTTGLRATGGVILSLPHGWQGSADYGWSKNWSSYTLPRAVARTTLTGINNGSIDVLRDLAVNPISYALTDLNNFSTSGPSQTGTASLRLAGPLPIKLPGGSVTITVQAQRSITQLSGFRSYSSTDTAARSSANGAYYPAREQTADSAYFEARIPVFGPANHIPLFNELEFQIAGRYERYSVTGAPSSVSCFAFTRPLTDADLDLPCPPSNATITYATSARGAFNPTYSAKWKPVPDLMLRGSFATGYRPPSAGALLRTAADVLVAGITDPARGNEPIGVTYLGIPGWFTVPGYTGGNTTVRPEHSTSYTAGFVLTPRPIPNFRLSVDWTRIIKRDNYFYPQSLLFLTAPTPDGQATFEDFLRAYPDRFTRCGTAAPYSVAPICTVDASIANLSGSRIGAVDFAVDYSSKLGGGKIEFALNATWLYDLKAKSTESSAWVQYAGVAGQLFFTAGEYGGAEWKGNASLRYSREGWSFGIRSNYVSEYWVNADHSASANLGSNKVPAQAYFDIFGTVRILKNTTLDFGVRNVFNKKPPYDNPSSGNLYSVFGDPRGGAYYVNLSRRF